MRRLLVAALLAAASSLVACGEDGASGALGGGGEGGAGGSGGKQISGNELPALSDLTPGAWNRLEPGGDTLCALGSPYAFFVYPGASDRVAVDFMGGGACWEASGLGTCKVGGPYSHSVESNVDFENPPADAGGVLDMQHPDNPLKGWTHVLIAYCTGDIHWGSNDHTYGSGAEAYVVHHRGATNATAALSWVYDNVPSPEKVLVTGCSAGAYGSILWSAHVQQHYPGVNVVQLADSGVGVITPEFRSRNFPHWNPASAFPSFISALDPAKVDVNSMELPDMYVAIGQHFPSMRLAQFNYLKDQTQQLFYLAMGGPVSEWSSTMLDHLASIHAGTPNFSSYVADGTDHCTIPWKRFYAEGVPGETDLATWTGQLIDGSVPDDVACETCVPAE